MREVSRVSTATLAAMPGWDDRERATLVALLRIRPSQVTRPQVVQQILEVGSARAVWDALIEPSLFDAPDGVPAPVAEAQRDIAGWRADGLGFHTFRDVSFPAQLREIHEVPPLLFSRGVMVADERAVSVVGSRRASDRALCWARELAEALVAADIAVLSGLAAGIDTAAHTAALRAGGRTVAVLGTGINRAYPPANRRLQERIACEGLVLSQFWPDATASKRSFPIRNATMSGYGRATIVVEAGETSGARIQARIAVEHGRPVILTDTVVRGNEWAQALRHRPGVHVASSIGEVLALVAELAADPDDEFGVLLDVRS